MDKCKLSLLDNRDINMLDDKYLTAELSDFAVLCGAYMSSSGNLGYYWVKAMSGKNEAYYMDFLGFAKVASVSQRIIGIRPTLKCQDVVEFFSDLDIDNALNERFLEVEYGHYPQSIANKDLQQILESKFQIGLLKKSFSKYTIDSKKYDDYNESLCKLEIEEYEYDEKRYVRIKSNILFDNSYKLQKNNTFVWVEVLPIKWLVDLKNNIIISKKILLAGIQYNKEIEDNENYNKVSDIFFFSGAQPNESGFEDSDIKRFLDECFSVEIMQNTILNKLTNNTSKLRFK